MDEIFKKTEGYPYFIQEWGKHCWKVAPSRASLINKGMIYSPAHGDNKFTVPLFDEFVKRVIPDI